MCPLSSYSSPLIAASYILTIPPHVDTELDLHIKDDVIESQGGPEKAIPPMPLKEYMAATTAQFEKGDEKEIAVGFLAMGVTVWRGTFVPILEQVGITG